MVTTIKQLIIELQKEPNPVDVCKGSKYTGDKDFIKWQALNRDMQNLVGLYSWEIVQQEISVDGAFMFLTGKIRFQIEGQHIEWYGTAGVDLRNKKGDYLPTNLTIPKANTIAFKNALKHAGRRFGADMDEEVEYQARTFEDIVSEVNNAQDGKHLKAVWDVLTSNEQKSEKIKALFSKRKNELQ